MQTPIDEVLIQNRRAAVAIAQQVLPVVLGQAISLLNHEQLMADPALDIQVEPGEMPPAADVVRYALEIGQEFVAQADQLLNQPIPGLTGTA